MQSVFVKFEVKKSELDNALVLIRDFVKKVRENESGTISYDSFQDDENPFEFIHVMTFANESAEERHQESEYCELFAKNLFEICVKEPEFQLLSPVC